MPPVMSLMTDILRKLENVGGLIYFMLDNEGVFNPVPINEREFDNAVETAY